MDRIQIKSKKGFTILELIIAIALAAIIAAVVFTFFMSNYKSLDKTSKKSDLQLQAAKINTLINEELMEASRIESMKNAQNQEVIDYSEASSPLIISYLDGEGKSSSLEITSKKVISIDGNGNKREIAAEIRELEVSPLINGFTFRNSAGLKLSFILGTESINYTFKSNAYFRNKSMEVN